MIDFGPLYSPENGTPQAEGELAWADPLRKKQSNLVVKAAAGDTEALVSLLEMARPIILRWALTRIKDTDDAEDITQQVLLRVCAGISSFRSESSLSTWLYRVTANEVAVFCRKTPDRCRTLPIPEWVDGTPTARPWKPEQMDRVKACVLIRNLACALPPLQLETFRLVDLEGLRPCEAAKALGRTQTNIRSSLCRARGRIRELVGHGRQEVMEELAKGSW